MPVRLRMVPPIGISDSKKSKNMRLFTLFSRDTDILDAKRKAHMKRNVDSKTRKSQ